MSRSVAEREATSASSCSRGGVWAVQRGFRPEATRGRRRNGSSRAPDLLARGDRTRGRRLAQQLCGPLAEVLVGGEKATAQLGDEMEPAAPKDPRRVLDQLGARGGREEER